MKYSMIFSTLALSVLPSIVNALPSKRDGLSDADILNFALTLEHLENAFYQQGLAKYTQESFTAAGYPEWTRGRFQQIADHEMTHVQFITTALSAAGAPVVEPCNYTFPYTDVESFIAVSFALESVGTSAYNGAARFIANKDYLTVAASILGVEARHSTWVNSAVRKFNPWNTAFETPLTFNQVYTLASAFITSCPASNPVIPTLKAFPSLNVTPVGKGDRLRVTFDGSKDHGPLSAAFLTGTGTVFSPIHGSETDVPEGLIGVVFVIVTSDGGKVDDDTTVAGPALLQLPFSSNGKSY